MSSSNPTSLHSAIANAQVSCITQSGSPLANTQGNTQFAARWALVVVLLCLSSTFFGCARNAAPLTKIATLELPRGVQSIAWSPDGDKLAIGYFMRDELEVLDVKSHESVLKVESKRRPINMSGQEAIFSRDGQLLVVQDFVDTKPGSLDVPNSQAHKNEQEARRDISRFVLARVYNMATKAEVAQIRGPASWLHGGPIRGMCWVGGAQEHLAVLRSSVVSVYRVADGTLVQEVSALHPFATHPNVAHGYWRMACHPTKAEVALEGGQLFAKARELGFSDQPFMTPIVVVDLVTSSLRQARFSPTPLNGLAYSTSGDKLLSFGRKPMRWWSSANESAVMDELPASPEVSDLVMPLPGTEGFLGVGAEDGAVFIFLVESPQTKQLFKFPTSKDTFRSAINAKTRMLAVAERSSVHLFQLSLRSAESNNQTGK